MGFMITVLLIHWGACLLFQDYNAFDVLVDIGIVLVGFVVWVFQAVEEDQYQQVDAQLPRRTYYPPPIPQMVPVAEIIPAPEPEVVQGVVETPHQMRLRLLQEKFELELFQIQAEAAKRKEMLLAFREFAHEIDSITNDAKEANQGMAYLATKNQGKKLLQNLDEKMMSLVAMPEKPKPRKEVITDTLPITPPPTVKNYLRLGD